MKRLLTIMLLVASSIFTYGQECDLEGMTTYTQGGWGSPSNSTPGSIRDEHFATVYPNGLILSGVHTITITSANAIENLLPGGGKPDHIDEDWTNPVKINGGGKNKITDIYDQGGVLVSQIIAAKLNMDFSEAGFLGPSDKKLGSLKFKSGEFEDMTIAEFLDLAIAAVTSDEHKKYKGYSYSDFNEAATDINENFDNGEKDKRKFVCGEDEVDDSKVDLQISKVVDNETPENNDEIQFTITVTNSGDIDATNVEISDIFPEELTLISTSPSTGEFDTESMEWSIPTLAVSGSANLTINAVLEFVEVNNSIIDLGTAKDYNVFVIEDIEQPSSDTEGRMAVGESAKFSNYSIGDKLPEESGDVLIVGENLTYISGRIYNGNLVYGESTNFPDPDMASVDGDIIQGERIDFNKEERYLSQLSKDLSKREDNMEMDYKYLKVTLYGTDPVLNTFNLDPAILNEATDFEINAPNGSVVLVNLSDEESVEISGGFNVYGTDARNVLFNFYKVDNLVIDQIDLTGSVLAPNTDVNFVDGVQNGQMIAKSIVGKGQFNNALFIGNIPSDISITNSVEITACDQIDIDSKPNNGKNDEDDYAEISLTFSANVKTEEALGNSSGTWQFVGGFGQDEIVLSVVTDKDENTLAGTWGGKISRSTDAGANWNEIYSDTSSDFIWDIVVDGSSIFAATENGVILSKNNGVDWTTAGLDDFDIRALLKFENVLYAGTWGAGLFTSDDDGESWDEFNKGFETNVFHDLNVDGNDIIYAATFGDGIYKLPYEADTWEKLGLDYRYVWNIGISADNYIYAGTYGAGLFRSTDGGESFSKLFNGIRAQHIYSITIDANDNVYAGSWSNGVFVSDDLGDTFQSLGMNGFGVSVIYNSDKTPEKRAGFNNIYVGTGSGEIYWNSPVTSVSNQTNPIEFALKNNYPNPFNPTTNIKFSVPQATFVTLKVYDMLGREIRTLVNSTIAGGNHEVVWNGKDDNGSLVSTGLYLYRLETQGFTKSHKMLLLK
ncbi:MAG: choice-of-anchor A family protein [Melioribacteraceae bacterium]|nr:choice-of-anchor A family protein [Melioribacteraceae bacterium]MCF8263863.1 choice-of-anchor A family protein [Melioribacteraceae bacterium]